MCVNVTRSRAGTLLQNVSAFVQRGGYQLLGPAQFTFYGRSVSSVWTLGRAPMNSATVSGGRGLCDPKAVEAPLIESCFRFTAEQKAKCGEQPFISDLVREKTARREFFYALEITGQTRGKPTCVDFHNFLPILPAFMSIVWLPRYYNIVPLERVETLQLTRHLEQYIPTVPHLSTFRLPKKRIDEFLALNFKEVLAVRGDKHDDQQDYHYSYQLVEHARRVRGDTISICVGGHPLGYVGLDEETSNMTKNVQFMKHKIDSGADYVITQICYTPELIVDFLRTARDAGITVPIILGVVTPDKYETYKLMEMISKISLPPDLLKEVESYKDDDAKVKKFFVQLTLRIIRHVMDANLNVYGIQFYTMNRFEPVYDVLCELRQLGILKKPAEDNNCKDA